MLHSKVKTYLEGLKQEQKFDVLAEDTIAQKIKEILTNDSKYKLTEEDKTEQIAFKFIEDCRNHNTGEGTYYEPMFILPDNQKNVLEYWAKRAEESTHPILSSRYADLIVDFSPKILRKRAAIHWEL